MSKFIQDILFGKSLATDNPTETTYLI